MERPGDMQNFPGRIFSYADNQYEHYCTYLKNNFPNMFLRNKKLTAIKKCGYCCTEEILGMLSLEHLEDVSVSSDLFSVRMHTQKKKE